MAKEKGLKHKEILKCIRCRLDKQKCLPTIRQWPGTKCNRCQEHGYQCSKPLSARSEKLNKDDEDEEEVADPQTVLRKASGASVSSRKVSLEAEDSGNRRKELIHIPRRRTTMIREPSLYRIVDSNSERLMERYADFWGSPMTFNAMCSPEFGKAITDVFRIDSRQISLADDMTNNAVMAFSAGDAALTQSVHSGTFTSLTHSHAMKAMSALRQRLKTTWPYLHDASIVLTAFNLFCYGLCVSDVSILQFTTWIIQTYHKSNNGFPINAEIVTGDNGYWIVRLFLPNNPDDRGLIMRHDTNTFEEERIQFEQRSGYYSRDAKDGTPRWGISSVPILASNIDPVVTSTVTDIVSEVLPITPLVIQDPEFLSDSSPLDSIDDPIPNFDSIDLAPRIQEL